MRHTILNNESLWPTHTSTPIIKEVFERLKLNAPLKWWTKRRSKNNKKNPIIPHDSSKQSPPLAKGKSPTNPVIFWTNKNPRRSSIWWILWNCDRFTRRWNPRNPRRFSAKMGNRRNFSYHEMDFAARPVCLQREDRIKAHFLICFMTSLIYCLLE